MQNTFFKRKFSLLSIGVMVAIMLVASVFSGCTKTEGPVKPLHFVQIPITYSAVTYIAEARGYFKAEGVNYSAISVPAGPDVVTALKGITDNSAAAGGIAVTPVITMIAAGDHPVVLATTLTSNRQAMLVTFSKSGITENPVTLRNKKIGVTLNTNGEIYLSRLLRKGGLSSKDAVLVTGRPADLRGLLLRGEIDAAVLWDPFVVQAIKEYKKQHPDPPNTVRGEPVALVDPTLHTLAFNVVTTQSKLSANREDLVRFLRATVKAEEFIKQNPKEAQALLEKWLNLESGDLNNFFATTEFDVRLDVNQMQQWMKEELEWFLESHPDVKVPSDLSPYVDSSLLKTIDPSRIK